MITAGKKSNVYWGKGDWIFLDIGFANKARSCGFAFGEELPQNLSYGIARSKIVDLVQDSESLINLVIEAPLSVCFDANRNPKGRSIENRDSETRYWYSGLECAVMTAAMYLIRDIHEATRHLPDVEIRLFEGFASFKASGTNHMKDVCQLRGAVINAAQQQDSIRTAEELKLCASDEICSAFRVADLDCGVPAVIIV